MRGDGLPQSLEDKSYNSDESIFTVKEKEGIDAIVGELLEGDSDDEVIKEKLILT